MVIHFLKYLRTPRVKCNTSKPTSFTIIQNLVKSTSKTKLDVHEIYNLYPSCISVLSLDSIYFCFMSNWDLVVVLEKVNWN